MFTRRIVACACALALAAPAAAAARPGFDVPVGQGSNPGVMYGDTKYDLQNTQDLAPKGDTKNDIKPSYPDRVGALSPAQLAAAYGMSQPQGTAIASAPVLSKRHVVVPAGKAGGRIVVLHHASASGSSNDLDGWRLAAIVEAGLLASIALAGAALVGRTRPQHGATA